jgi:hypothetical protein
MLFGSPKSLRDVILEKFNILGSRLLSLPKHRPSSTNDNNSISTYLLFKMPICFVQLICPTICNYHFLVFFCGRSQQYTRSFFIHIPFLSSPEVRVECSSNSEYNGCVYYIPFIPAIFCIYYLLFISGTEYESLYFLIGRLFCV